MKSAENSDYEERAFLRRTDVGKKMKKVASQRYWLLANDSGNAQSLKISEVSQLF